MAGAIRSLQSGGMATARNEELRSLAKRVADALPADLAEEIVLTGSVSRGMADEVSDIEMLVVTREPLELEDCFRAARAAGLDELDSWGAQGGPTRRVSGYRDRVPLALIWWPRDYAEEQIDALLAGSMPSTADALAHGIALRTSGRFAAWRERLCAYPPDLAGAQIEEATMPWGGFTPAGLLTLIRPGDRLALTEPDPRHALSVMTELQLDTVLLAPSRQTSTVHAPGLPMD